MRGAFTLIELLVVVAILALLMAILLPSLHAARKEARTVQCATNLHHIGRAVHVYLSRDRVFPVSYGYMDLEGNVNLRPEVQEVNSSGGGADSGSSNGYVHWSYFLYSDGKVDDKAFQCPEYTHGGAPRTNPGPDPSDWEPGQKDDNEQTTANGMLEDKQARRMAYTANAAVMPRNKFTAFLSGSSTNPPRINKLINDSQIRQPGRVIMATEFNQNWEAISKGDEGGRKAKSHRPINPFYSVSAGSDEYNAPIHGSGRPEFYLGIPRQKNFGLLPLASVANQPGLIDSPSGEINAVGRHHPGGEKVYGGTANFLYTDAHVARKTVLDTMTKFEWGDRYYTLTGDNQVARVGDAQ